MQKSETIGELAKALAIVQGKIGGAKMDGNNPFFHAKYATLGSVWDACQPLLSENGLAVVQTSSLDETHKVVIDTTLMHSSGEWISGSTGLTPTKDDPQQAGSAITYARRYGLSAMIGICPEDDDGNEASKPKEKAKPKETAPKQDQKETTVKLPTEWSHLPNVGSMLTRCNEYKIGRTEAFEILNVTKATEIPDADEAWECIAENKGIKLAE